MSGAQFERVAAYLDERIAAGDFPGAVFVLRERGVETGAVARGHSVVVPERIAATTDTLFDLASLTKPLSTTLLLVMEIERGSIRLDDPVASYLPEFSSVDKRAITVRKLATHSSGLPKWTPLYIEPGSPDRVLSAIADLELAYSPGTRVVYSDPNYVVLGALVERVAGRPLDTLFSERVAAPLGLRDTGFRPDPSLRPRIAASETGNVFERDLAGPIGRDYAGWRRDVIWGDVHDGNAFFLGGVAGHAGLFGPAGEAARVAEQFLPGSALIHDARSFSLFTTNATPGLDEHRSVGWMLASTPDCSAGRALSAGSFGHTGFTGTSVWVDPHARRVFMLATNRTHPVWKSLPMNAIRRRVHELAIGG